MKNNISGKIKELSLDKFLNLFDKSVHNKITMLSKLDGTEALVCFEVLQMDSSCFGDRTCLAVGDGRTYKLNDLKIIRLGDVPSRFAYPVALTLIST